MAMGIVDTHRWFITELTDNALKVMTQMGNFVYYRVHPKIIKMNLGDYIECEDDDYFVFADGIKVLIRLYRYCPWMSGMAASQIFCYNGTDKKVGHAPPPESRSRKQGDRFLFQLSTVKSAKALLCMCD